MNAQQARNDLEALALEVGFDVAGWAEARVSAHSVQEYRGWLERGLHAGMDYLERGLARRADLSSSLEGARSVLVLGVSHAFEDPGIPAGGVRVGRVARYAWTPDYHHQLAPLLARLEAAAARLGVRTRGYVDHGPILERELAGRAFLGWRGKSGMLVSTRLGAFLTLAVLLTDLPAEPEAPAELPMLHPDRCGRCTACVRACPTHAILEGRVIDAGRCVSYLTIEHRGPVPAELRPGVGTWLFGCDGCTEVCPWSVKAGPVARHLQPSPHLAHPDLTPFFTLTNRQFDRRYAKTAFARPRRKGMARNACTVLGNLRDPQHLPLLALAARDEAPEVREAAAWALGRVGGRAATALLEGLRQDPRAEVACTAQLSLEAALS
ncbi:epoxyqueuosine reductase [Deinobacterium chartae]|uniref:Epoxyqueuosine reductase n=1 Tax=Deinobacterium chartae TaxID=521158 RepID=A0A841I0K6_9DEIO|nr:tRNA epoxyqueuosine(34) reductase QueG [Deinobacterium chartae]MBB6099197.1 epoxyqueuosine reductase [Deinobacterium chartae]